MKEKRWFISEDSKVCFVQSFINKNIKWFGDKVTHLIVSISDLKQIPVNARDVKVESINIENFFNTKEEAQMEIIKQNKIKDEKEFLDNLSKNTNLEIIIPIIKQINELINKIKT